MSSLSLHHASEPEPAEIAIALGIKSLDALHLGAAQRVGGAALPFLTYDLRQAQAARALGWTVLGG